MNVKNNKHHQNTTGRIERAFISLLKDRSADKISVTELCEVAGVERGNFYENYKDMSALVNEISAKIETKLETHPHTESEFAWIFDYIQAHKLEFDIYFKLGMSHKSSDYKSLCFRNGVYGVAKMWFESGCVESPDQMGKILKREYNKLFANGKA